MMRTVLCRAAPTTASPSQAIGTNTAITASNHRRDATENQQLTAAAVFGPLHAANPRLYPRPRRIPPPPTQSNPHQAPAAAVAPATRDLCPWLWAGVAAPLAASAGLLAAPKAWARLYTPDRAIIDL